MQPTSAFLKKRAVFEPSVSGFPLRGPTLLGPLMCYFPPMTPRSISAAGCGLGLLACMVSCTSKPPEHPVPAPVTSQVAPAGEVESAQTPTWSSEDREFFLHGSMSTEIVPVTVLRAFMRTYPDLFPNPDFSNLGVIQDTQYGWPIGFSRRPVTHLGGLPSVGVNCAACHSAEITPVNGGAPVRVLGVSSHFDAEGFFGAIIVSTFRTQDPMNMKHFLEAYLMEDDAVNGEHNKSLFELEWQRQQANISVEMAAVPMGTNSPGTGKLYIIGEDELHLNRRKFTEGVNLAVTAQAMLKLFHNMRASLHLPDEPPAQAPPPSGPGRNDAFGLLSAVLFGVVTQPTPVKYGLVWNLEERHWVHWDGNTQSPLGRNLLASIGLGAPLVEKHALLDFANIKRQTDLSEKIRAPKYPFAIDEAASKRGEAHYKAQCASCHDGSQMSDAQLYSVADVGADPLRAKLFTPEAAGRFNTFLAELKATGYTPPKEPAIRSTEKYWACNLAGVWARSPYLHNGSVRTMQELLTAPTERAKTFHRGSKIYDTGAMGYTDAGSFLLDTSVPASSNSGHDYGTKLAAAEKADLIEFLKSK